MGKRIVYIASTLAASVLFSGCHPASSDTLYRQAQAAYGKCSIVSKSETDSSVVVVLHDELQDFDYKIVSSMSDITIDGSYFGSVPSTSDTFKTELKLKVISDSMSELNDIFSADDMSYTAVYDGNDDRIITVRVSDEDVGISKVLDCADILQTSNKNNRLDGYLINVEDNNSEHLGSVRLPDVKWRTIEEENADYFTEMAHMQTDPKARYLRCGSGKFSDTGADLKRVVSILGTEYPTELDSPVMFYYFESSDGSEYFLCDFNYYKEDSYTEFGWYTNYALK